MHQKTSILIYHIKFKNSLFEGVLEEGGPQVLLQKGPPARCPWSFLVFYAVTDRSIYCFYQIRRTRGTSTQLFALHIFLQKKNNNKNKNKKFQFSFFVKR